MICHSQDDVSNLLWNDADCLTLRHVRSAEYLAAIRELVAQQQFGGEEGAEFLHIFDHLAAANPADFTAVWTDPAAYLWARTAYQLLGAHFGSVDLSPTAASWQVHYGFATTEAAAVHQLACFKLLALGLALRTGQDWELEEPLTVKLPVTIPGTRWSLDGEGTICIHAVHGNQLKVSQGQRILLLNKQMASDGGACEIVWNECPLVRWGACELRMQAAIFRLPGIGYGEPLHEAGPAFQQDRIELAQAVLQAVERYAPNEFEQIAAHMQVLALKPAHGGDYGNVSHSELPGACVLSVLNEPVIMADRMIHEFHHNRLFCVEEQCGAFFDSERQDAIRDKRYYSPWRDEPRSLHGILHALYVTQPVWKYWRRVRSEGAVSEQLLAFADDQLRRLPLQHARAVEVLRTHGHFTEQGWAIFEGIAANAENIYAQAAVLTPRETLAYTLNLDGAITPQLSRSGDRHVRGAEAVEEHFRLFAGGAQSASPTQSGAELEPALT
jgi:HEXXH motif-containing protein